MKEPQPYFRSFDGWWYVQIRQGGRRIQIKLAKGRDSEAEARQSHHQLMAKTPVPAPSRKEGTVVAVLDDFLEELKGGNTTTYKWYLMFLSSFGKHVGRELLVSELKKSHVLAWIKAKAWKSGSTKNGAVRAVRRAFRWAAEEAEIIDRYPLAGLKAPPKTRRERVVTPVEFQTIIAKADDKFRDLMQFLWNTGARPQEAFAVEARHFQPQLRRIVFPASESKGKKRPRVIYLNDVALAIVTRLAKRHATGAIFRMRNHKPWNANAVVCRFRRMAKRIGVKYCSYHLRHSFATRMLEAGTDSMTVAALLGHADLSQLGRTYAHLGNSTHLLDELQKAV